MYKYRYTQNNTTKIFKSNYLYFELAISDIILLIFFIN